MQRLGAAARALAERSHAQAGSGGRDDPRGSFPWFALRAPPRPPLLPGSPLRSVGAQLQPGAAGGGISKDARPRPRQEEEDAVRRGGHRGGGPGMPPTPPHLARAHARTHTRTRTRIARRPSGAQARGACHLLDVFPHLRPVIADHQQLQRVIHKSVLQGQGKPERQGPAVGGKRLGGEVAASAATALVSPCPLPPGSAPFGVLGAKERHQRRHTPTPIKGRSSPPPTAPSPCHLLTPPLTCHRSEAG